MKKSATPHVHERARIEEPIQRRHEEHARDSRADHDQVPHEQGISA
jgi:hypothetical protein